MNAKEYLSEVRRINDHIIEQEEYIQRLRDSLDIQGISYDKEKVQTSPDKERMSKVFAIIIDAEKELEELKTEFIQFRVKVIQQIYDIDDPVYKQILNQVYIDYKTLKECSMNIGFSYDYTRELHLKALKAFEEKFPQ